MHGGRHLVRIGAGENWHSIVERLLDVAVPGLENLALIPGSVGAAPIQNIGAYGVELAERFESLAAFDTAYRRARHARSVQCRFGYRDSVFKQVPGRHVVLERDAGSADSSGGRCSATPTSQTN